MTSIISEGATLWLSTTSRRSGSAVTMSARTIAVKVARNSLDEGRRNKPPQGTIAEMRVKTEEVTQRRRPRRNKSSGPCIQISLL
jgi:hypothetical protein